MSTFGGTIKLSGETEYRKALSNITTNLKVLSSEMKIVTSQYDKTDTSTQNLTQQNTILNKKIEEQRQSVNTLTTALAQAKEETGDNSDTTKKWQIELNKAQAELNKLEKNLNDNNKKIDENEKSLSELDNELKDSTNSMNNFSNATKNAGNNSSILGDVIKGNLISQGIMSGIRALGDAMKTVGSTLVNIGKQAIQSYGEYQQLIGGVETLFGDSAGIVEKNANNAFKTAGISANKYMEQVTSFSASLLQSTGKDTQKAAEYADMAIKDMADNANKMGTSMDSIQNAYQGFAKQNYTMLDNLKLGYGGTKSEMLRLLEDASKISGIKYDISSLSDVYEAIHIVQQEIGITGTTALEAEGTLTGSFNSMTAAWQNLLTGVASGQDISGLINNLVNSISTSAKNLFPVIKNTINGIIDLILNIGQEIINNSDSIMQAGFELLQKLFDGIMNNSDSIMQIGFEILQKLFDGIIGAMPQITNIFSELLVKITSFLIANLPMLVNAGIQMMIGLVNGIAEALPTLIPMLVESILNILITLLSNQQQMWDCGMNLLFGLIDGIFNALPVLIEKLPEIIIGIVTNIIAMLPRIVELGGRIIQSLTSGIFNLVGTLFSRMPEIITGIKVALSNGISQIFNVGKDLVVGLWNGITSVTDWIMDKIKGFGASILNGIKSFFGIHSPSRLMKDEVGKNLALGIGEGFTENMASITNDMTNAIPTEFDTNINANIANTQQDNMLAYVKEALKDVKIVMNDREFGSFVVDTVNKELYA